MAYTLLGKDFTPPDLRAKVTGRGQFAEDFRAEGMAFCRLLTSEIPHGRVNSIDTSEALAMEGVLGVLTADDVPTLPGQADPILSNEPMWVGQPILAVAAVDETTAQNALESISLDIEPLPFVTDPLDSLYPAGPDARSGGNVAGRNVDHQSIKWTARDFVAAGEGQLPMGAPLSEWTYGDLEAQFAAAEYVLEDNFVTSSTSHHSMEPRTAMAYWENGRCYLHGSSQSGSFPVPMLARWIGIEASELVFIAEYCGGGFGSKGNAYPAMTIPAHMSKMIGRPVMMRISRHEEYGIGSARPAFQGRIRMGFAPTGRLAAVDMYIVQDNGPNIGFNDWFSAGEAVSLVYTPEAMRFRGIPVLTNTPQRGPQRGPGQNQIAAAIEPLIDKAARALGLSQFEIRRINAPNHDVVYGGRQRSVTSSYMGEALDIGAEEFDLEAKLAQSGERNGSKVIGVGIGQAYHSAGSSGFDGLVRITPDGMLHIHTGVGNLGTFSHTATSRVAAEVLKCSWDNCTVVRGDTRKHLPWNFGQFGSNTSFTMTRTNYAAAMDALAKLKEIAATDLGGTGEDYDIADEKVFLKSDPTKALTYAEAAQRAIELGGKFSGEETPDDINRMTTASVTALAGTGLIGVAKDNMERPPTVPALAAGFMQIELDLETGKWDILDYLGVADCGTVIHPLGLANQIKGGAVQGIGMAAMERFIVDPQNGLPANVGLYQAKPPSYLDVPAFMSSAAVDLPDPHNPVGAKGIGEPIMGCATAALLCAISDALGGHVFNRVPVVPDMVINAVAGREQSYSPLQLHTA
ncbi:MAG: xanthine dehydrogenase family protein molybdopterin-binding subunit [Candidatus Rariloculaceae bacterium]